MFRASVVLWALSHASLLHARDHRVLGTTQHRLTSPVVECEFSPDGTATVVATADGGVSLIETERGRPTWKRIPFPRPPVQLVCCRDERAIAVVDRGGNVKLLSWESGETTSSYPAEGGRSLDLRVIADGELASVLAVEQANHDVMVSVRRVVDGELLGTIEVDDSPESARLSRDGRRLIILLPYARASVWDLTTGERIGSELDCTRFAGFRTARLAYQDPDTPLVLLSCDKKVIVVNLATGQPVYQREAENSDALAISRDGKLLATAKSVFNLARWQTTVELLDIENQTTAFRTQIVGNSGVDTVMSEDGQFLAVLAAEYGCRQHSLRLWKISSRRRIDDTDGHFAPVSALAFSPTDGRTLASSSPDRSVRLWDVTTKERLMTLTEGMPSGSSLAISQDGQYLTATGIVPKVVVWSLPTGKPVSLFPHAKWRVPRAVCFARDGRIAIGGSESNRISGQTSGTNRYRSYETIDVWETRDRQRFSFEQEVERLKTVPLSLQFPSVRLQVRGEMSLHRDDVNSVVFSPQGDLLATGGTCEDGVNDPLALWDPARGKLIRRFGKCASIYRLSYSTDGKRIAGVCSDEFSHRSPYRLPQVGIVKVWNVADGTHVATLRQCTETTDVLFYGNEIITSHANDAIKIWNLEERRTVDQWTANQHGVLCLAISPDNKLLASGGTDTTIRVWDLGSAKE